MNHHPSKDNKLTGILLVLLYIAIFITVFAILYFHLGK